MNPIILFLLEAALILCQVLFHIIRPVLFFVIWNYGIADEKIPSLTPVQIIWIYLLFRMALSYINYPTIPTPPLKK